VAVLGITFVFTFLLTSPLSMLLRRFSIVVGAALCTTSSTRTPCGGLCLVCTAILSADVRRIQRGYVPWNVVST
jgi:hypothetical protein